MAKDELYNEKAYKVVKVTKHERYGDFKLLEHKETGEQLVEIIRNFPNEGELTAAVAAAKLRKAQQCDNIQKLVNFQSTSKQNLCSKTYQIQLLFEYSENNLFLEIKNRKLQQFDMSFPLHAVLKILDSITNALLHKKTFFGELDGDVRPYNVLVFPDNTFKVVDGIAGKQNIKAYQQLMLGLRTDNNISPELYEQLKKKDITPTSDPEKDDVFALGILGLKICLLDATLDFYENEAFQPKLVAQYCEQVAKNYESEELAALLYDMLRTLPSERLDLIQVSERLHNFNEKSVHVEAHHSYQPTPQASKKEAEVNYGVYELESTRTSIHELEAKINQLLSQSRFVVMKYGGENGIKIYESTKDLYVVSLNQSAPLATGNAN